MDNKELTIYDTSLSSLATLEEFYSDSEINLNTKEGLEDAKGIAKKFQKLRTGVENIRKEANTEARAHIKAVDDKAKSIQARIEPLEMRYAEPIKKRKEGFEKQIQNIDNVVEVCAGRDSVYISECMEWLETINPYDFAEYKKQCADSLFTAKDQLTTMFANVIEREAKEREEQERVNKMAIDAAINNMKVMVANAMDWKRSKIEEAIDYLNELLFDDGTYGDREKEAEQVRDEVIKKLGKLYAISEDETESPYQLTDSDQDAPMFNDCVADKPNHQQEALDALLYQLDGDVELAEKLLLNIQSGNVAHIYFKSN